ncbi:MAG: matrixin family metalloprotease [Candidatus Micrarchaeota archaeon]|nr:matrixin family metalloprotease [Candidatus Micrarchaeota archaeon]
MGKRKRANMKAIISIAAATLAVGCMLTDHPGNRYTVYIDPAFGDSENENEIVNAFQEWKDKVEAVGFLSLSFDFNLGYLRCQDDGNCTHVITIHPSTKHDIALRSDAEPGEIGVCHREWTDRIMDGANDWSDIYIASDIGDPDKWVQTIKHEIGHSLGLPHLGEGALMCAYLSCASHNEITCADLQEYANLRGESINCK